MKFEKFMVFNQDNEGIVETRHGEFTCGIAELHGLYVVHVVTVKDGYNYACAVYRDVQEAAAQVAELKNFALKVDSEHQGFIFSIPEENVTALEVVDALS